MLDRIARPASVVYYDQSTRWTDALVADPSKGNADTCHRPSPKKDHLVPHVQSSSIGCLFNLDKANERRLLQIRMDQGNQMDKFAPQMRFLTNHVSLGRGRPSSPELYASQLFPELPLYDNSDDRDVIRQWSSVLLDPHAWRAWMKHCVMSSCGLYVCGRNIAKKTHHAYTEATEKGALNYLLYLHRINHKQGALLPMPISRPDWSPVQAQHMTSGCLAPECLMRRKNEGQHWQQGYMLPVEGDRWTRIFSAPSITATEQEMA